MHKQIRIIILLGAALGAGPLQADTLDMTPGSRTSVGLTIYNDDLALVNDAYTANFTEGDSVLNFEAISPLINHASAILHPLPNSLRVRNQYFRAAMTPQDLLARSLGQTVSLIGTHPLSGEQTRQRARVLSVSGGLILEIDGRYETDLAGRRIVYDALPEGVLSSTLSIGVSSAATTQSSLVLSYLTGGLSWRADYIAKLNNAQDILQLTAMASLYNNSGIDFQAVQVELVAGSVNQVRGNVAKQRSLVMAMESAPDTQHTPLADLHLYALPDKVDLFNNSSRQVMLFEARDVPVELHYQLGGQPNLYYSPNAPEQNIKVDSFIEFSNGPDKQMGEPMPAGVVRVYAQAKAESDRLRFIGEDQIDHTPAHAKVRLKTGQAFDLSATRKQIAYRRLPVEQPFRHHSEAKVQILLSNAKDGPVTVRVQEAFSGEWTLIDGPAPDESDARTASWNVGVPAHGEATLTLLVRVKS
jgi:hypothetical protein